MSSIKKSRDQTLDAYLAVVEVVTTAQQEMPVVDMTKGLARAEFLVDSTGAPVTGLNPLPVTGTSTGHGSPISHTRPANTPTYDAGDVIGQTDTATSSAFAFTNIAGASGGDVMITSASLEIDLASIPSGMTSFNLALYNVTPPSALVDAATWDVPSGDRASFLGLFSLGSPVDLGSTLYVEQNGINKQVTALGSSLFGYLVTVGGYIAASGTVYKVTLHSVAL